MDETLKICSKIKGLAAFLSTYKVGMFQLFLVMFLLQHGVICIVLYNTVQYLFLQNNDKH